MGLFGKKVVQVDINCNGNTFFGLYRYRTNNLSKIAPDLIQGCDLLEGERGVVGSISIWNFKVDGKSLASKTILEAVDEKNKSITYKFIEGDVMLAHKSFKATIQFTENGENKSVTWTLEYEKMNEDVPDPDLLVDLAYKVTKAIETHLLK